VVTTEGGRSGPRGVGSLDGSHLSHDRKHGRGMFTGKITLRSYFENAAGLKVGAPVNLEGVTVAT